MDNNFFPVFLDLTGRKVLVYGAGNIAARRVELLLRFGAEITIIAPEVMPKMEEVIQKFKQGDCEVNEGIFRECRHRELLVNVITDKEKCNFHFPAVVKKENVIIGIASGGENHGKVSEIAAKLRDMDL